MEETEATGLQKAWRAHCSFSIWTREWGMGVGVRGGRSTLSGTQSWETGFNNRASWGESHRQVDHITLTSSRGPAGVSLTSGSCLPLASRIVMMELGMCAC